jgi:hypothetical protein
MSTDAINAEYNKMGICSRCIMRLNGVDDIQQYRKPQVDKGLCFCCMGLLQEENTSLIVNAVVKNMKSSLYEYFDYKFHINCSKNCSIRDFIVTALLGIPSSAKRVTNQYPQEYIHY